MQIHSYALNNTSQGLLIAEASCLAHFVIKALLKHCSPDIFPGPLYIVLFTEVIFNQKLKRV
jgi:hypothetical protein